ncbi:hypothetical protein CC80DRAFT_175968 [Byssothecium circinans]|uniref:Uncharacterized protein n=1 Tax=Byssothecium circinans TaxID=147558 RepID=A0A6A5TKQ8_9PLEO|nr:hypothetical protein CC80DRAFT_175968 [Byssothecium circinans]
MCSQSGTLATKKREPKNPPIHFLGIPFPSIEPNRPHERPLSLPVVEEPQQNSGVHIPKQQKETSHDPYRAVKPDAPGHSPVSTRDPGDLVFAITSPRKQHNELFVLRLKGFEVDEDLFHALRYLYLRSRRWTRYFVGVTEIHYVKFEFRGSRTRVSKEPDLPPVDRLEYDYEPRPARRLPPVGPKFLAYLFNTPDSAHAHDFVFKTLPKLLDAEQSVDIASRSDCGPREGWGLLFVEGVKIAKVSNFIISYLALITAASILLVAFGQANLHAAFDFFTWAWIVFGIGLVWLLHWFTHFSGDPPQERTVTVAHRVDAHSSRHHGLLRVIVPVIRKAYACWHNLLDIALCWAEGRGQPHFSTFEGGRCQVRAHSFSSVTKNSLIGIVLRVKTLHT